MEKERINNRKQNNRFFIMLLIFEVVIAVCIYHGVVRSYNATMLSLSYKYGFTSRSLLGTIYQGLADIMPFDMYNYDSVVVFANIVTVAFFVVIMAFTYYCLSHTVGEKENTCKYLLFFFDTFAVSTFFSDFNFLRVDVFMIVIALICAVLICKDKFIWMIIPLSAIGVMFHQGFVFMYFNIALALSLYQAFDKKNKRKYIIVFAASFITASALFIWFEFLSRSNGAQILDEVINNAEALTLNSQYHPALIAHEVLGIDLATSEAEWHKMNLFHLGFFTVLFIPYIVIFVRFFKDVFKSAVTLNDKMKYIVILLGALTILPDFILKIDYGRWIMATITYYAVVLCALAVMGDKIIVEQLDATYKRIKAKPWSMFLLLYPIMFIPLCDTDIDNFTQQLSAWLNHIVGFYSIR